MWSTVCAAEVQRGQLATCMLLKYKGPDWPVHVMLKRWAVRPKGLFDVCHTYRFTLQMLHSFPCISYSCSLKNFRTDSWHVAN